MAEINYALCAYSCTLTHFNQKTITLQQQKMHPLTIQRVHCIKIGVFSHRKYTQFRKNFSLLRVFYCMGIYAIQYHGKTKENPLSHKLKSVPEHHVQERFLRSVSCAACCHADASKLSHFPEVIYRHIPSDILSCWCLPTISSRGSNAVSSILAGDAVINIVGSWS